MREVEALYMLGSCRNGRESDKGELFHAVPLDSSRALCGKRPGPRSAGWAAHDTQRGEIDDINCERCKRAMAREAADA